MFINCKHCGSLVATVPATDLPPERCPRCRGVLRSPAAAPQVSVAALLRSAPGSDTAAASGVTPDDPLPVTAPPPPAGPTPTASGAPPAVLAPAKTRVEMSADTPPVVEPTVAPPTAEAAPVAAPPASGSPDPGTAAVDADPQDQAATPMPDVAPLPAPTAGIHAPAPARVSPSFARRGAAGPRDAHLDRQRRLLVVTVFALTLLLGLQIAIADRARLATDPGWRPALAALCSVLRCSLPPWREPAALTLLARDVRPDPGHADRLLAVATFRNDARWAQAWPHVRLTLSDIHGQTVGTRVFGPDDYLDAAPSTPTLPAGQSANVRLHLREPDAGAVSFAFDFL